MHCPKCRVPALNPRQEFCPRDGARLVSDESAFAAACKCGANAQSRGADGFCAECGRRWPNDGPPPDARPVELIARDHIEGALDGSFAFATDRGQHHAHNQDDVAIGSVGEWRALVVCDGVSSTRNSAQASRVGAQTACEWLLRAARDRPRDAMQIMREAIARANDAVCALSHPKDDRAASCTIVAALMNNRELFVGWMGDSRAYWLDPSGAQLLSRDHSWLNEVVDAGQMSEADASQDKRAHAITRCLGPLDDHATPDDAKCDVKRVALPKSGLLLLCSDGLWNYAPNLKEMNDLSTRNSSGDALELCRALCAWANEQGGRDNISIAVARK